MFGLPVGMYSYNFGKCVAFVTNKVMPTCIYNAQQCISTLCTPTISLISSFELWPYNVYNAPNLNNSHFRSLTSSFTLFHSDQFSHPYSSATPAFTLYNFNHGQVSYDVMLEHVTKFCRKSRGVKILERQGFMLIELML
jgi:hypothetical protein